MAKKVKRTRTANGESAEGGAEGEVTEQKPRAIPQGYEERSSDVVGFWDPNMADFIHFVPLEAKAFDSKLDATKPSTLIVGKLVEPILLKVGEDEEVEGKAGDMVGVWAKPGMRALADLCGVPVYMYPDGEIETGKPNPMKVFRVLSKVKGTKLPLTEDKREKSRHVATFLAPARDAQGRAQRTTAAPEQGEDDVPF